MRQLLSIVFLAFFLMGQVNLTMASHFCDDVLKSTKVGIALEKSSCCDDKDVPPMDCCDDQFTQSDSDEFFGKSKVSLEVNPSFVLAYTLVFFDGLNGDVKTTHFIIDDEDVPIPDYQILFQTFLI